MLHISRVVRALRKVAWVPLECASIQSAAFALACALVSLPVNAAPDRAVWTGTVVYVVDGDTLHVRPPDGGKPISVRLHGIDAPEICQAGGKSSRDALARRTFGRMVVVTGKYRDDYGRLLARLHEGGEDVGGWMVGRGEAWSARFHRSTGPYRDQQARAQAARRGLFSSSGKTAMPAADSAVYPADFRKQHGPCRQRSAGGRDTSR